MRSAARNAITLLALRSQSNTSKLLATPVDNVLGILLCVNNKLGACEGAR